MTDREISARSGLPAGQVWAISWQTDWRGVDVYTLRAFCLGCGVDLNNHRDLHRIKCYMRAQGRAADRNRQGWGYLRRHPEWTTRWAPMMIAFRKSL